MRTIFMDFCFGGQIWTVTESPTRTGVFTNKRTSRVCGARWMSRAELISNLKLLVSKLNECIRTLEASETK